MTLPVVTISAPYGAAGPIVGRAVADRLGVPFLDRAIPTAVAQTLAVSLVEAEAHDERADTRVGRMLSALAASGLGFGPTPQPGVPAEAFREETERVIVAAAKRTGCVVLGRAAVMVLRDHPSALHTCLTGPLEQRIRQAMRLSNEGEDEAAVRKLVEETDRNRKAYFRHFYGVDPDDSSLYHVTLDSTALDLDTCADFIATAARLRSAS
ncbi:MAG: cytidylate kinase-like family protein [Acidimicrobiia bacterium]